MFQKLLQTSESSESLFLQIAAVDQVWMRIQLCRVFRKYVSPEIPVEMLKQKAKVQAICEQFGNSFRGYSNPTRPVDF